MTVWVDRFAALWLDATLAAAALTGIAAMAMLACRQPVRRLVLARAAVLGAAGLLPLVVLAPTPRVEVIGWLHDSGLRDHPLLAGSPVPTTSASPFRSLEENAFPR